MKYKHLSKLILSTAQCCSTNNNQGGYYHNLILQALELLLGRYAHKKKGIFETCGTRHVSYSTSKNQKVPVMILLI